MKTDLFLSCGHCWVFQICWHIECSTFTASSFRIWNSSTGIPSPPLALFVVMFPEAHLISHPGYLALGQWPHHRDYLGREDLFCTVLLCILAISSFTVIKEMWKHSFIKKTCTIIFIEALLIRVKNWKQPKYLLTRNLTNIFS